MTRLTFHAKLIDLVKSYYRKKMCCQMRFDVKINNVNVVYFYMKNVKSFNFLSISWSF
jgi:hypothetical protein